MNKFKKFEGVFPAVVTPFDAQGNVKWNGLRQVIRYLIDVQKVDGLYLTGSTGEFLLISHEDRKKIMQIVAEEAKNAVTLIAQIGSLNLTHVKELAALAANLKYDAISAITPYYYSYGFEEVKTYYEEISTASNLPMLVYYLPQLAKAQVSVEQLGEILKIKNVIGVKYGSTDVFYFERLRARYPESLLMYAWDEALSLGLAMGAKGFIGSTFNINAHKAREIITTFNNKDFALVEKLSHSYNNYISDLLSCGLMQTLKSVMRFQGVDAGYTKKPFKLHDDATCEKNAKFIVEKHLKN